MRATPRAVSHQTVRLARGRHRSPDQGACAVELASMLGGERFSDRPKCVSRVVAAFLRNYNDHVYDSRRQDLFEYASLAVGTRASRRVEVERAQRCLDWLAWRLGPDDGQVRSLALWPKTAWHREAIAAAAARYAASSRERHEDAMRLLDRLI